MGFDNSTDLGYEWSERNVKPAITVDGSIPLQALHIKNCMYKKEYFYAFVLINFQELLPHIIKYLNLTEI